MNVNSLFRWLGAYELRREIKDYYTHTADTWRFTSASRGVWDTGTGGETQGGWVGRKVWQPSFQHE